MINRTVGVGTYQHRMCVPAHYLHITPPLPLQLCRNTIVRHFETYDATELVPMSIDVRARACDCVWVAHAFVLCGILTLHLSHLYRRRLCQASSMAPKCPCPCAPCAMPMRHLYAYVSHGASLMLALLFSIGHGVHHGSARTIRGGQARLLQRVASHYLPRDRNLCARALGGGGEGPHMLGLF